MQFIGSLQKKHGVTSFELLGKVAPIQAAMLTVLGPFVDYFLTSQRVIDYPFSMPALVRPTILPNVYTHRSFLFSSKIHFSAQLSKASSIFLLW